MFNNRKHFSGKLLCGRIYPRSSPEARSSLRGRSLSTTTQQVKSILNENLSRDKFYQWFTGFTDGEGLFLIWFNNKGQCAFKFEIGLHLDDKGALDFIHKELEIGKVWTRDNKVFFTVIRQNEIYCLIHIFTKYPLKSSKGLNFLEFKKAFELYTSSKSKSDK